MAYYLARRYLSMSPREWDALAWWEQRMYLEGYEEEGLIEPGDGSADPTVVNERVHHSGGTTITERRHHATFSGQPGELTAFGFTERTLG